MGNYIEVLLVLFIFYLIQFVIGQIKKNNSIVDIFWGLGFVIAAIYAVLSNGHFQVVSLIVMLLVSIWGLRLTYHIGKRNKGKSEDFRYVNFRKGWGTSWMKTKAFLHVYMLQMIMLLLISSSYLHTILKNRPGIMPLDYIGIAIWCIGFYFEARSDYELKEFKADKNNKGKIMTKGLYKYSRHPNYFGEAIMWWGIYIIGLSSGGWLFIISPLTITILVRFVSGVPMLEKHYENNDAFQAYAEKTNVFVPWFPKKVGGLMFVLKKFLVTAGVFFTIDILWLAIVAKKLYQKHLGFIMTDQVNVFAAAVFYIIFIIGMIVFVINPALAKESLTMAMSLGLFFGFVTYATYDLTNLATLRDWPLMITLIDISWGTFLSGAVSTISYLLLK